MRAKLFLGAASTAFVMMAIAPNAGAQSADVPGDSSTQARVAGSVDGEVSPAADGDWYRLRVERGQRYQINLDAVTAEDGSGLDPTLAIYDGQGNQIAFNDDASGSLNSALTYTPDQSGEVFIEARGFLDQSVGRYQLRVETSVAPADDSGNDASTRGRAAPGRDVSGSIEYEGDIDWYRLTTRGGQRYRVTLNGGQAEGQLADPVLRVIDHEGNEVASNDDSDGLNSMLEYIPAQAGDVFIEASGFGGAQTGAYTLAVSAEALPTDNAAAATNTRARIAPGQSISSEIAYPNDGDWYRVSLAEGQAYRFTLSGAGDSPVGDPLLRILDNRGEELAVDDDGGDGLNSYLEFTAPSTGNYFLDARSFAGDGVGGYTLTADAGDIPGDASTDASLAAEGDARQGMLAPGGDRDWYRVDLEAGQGMRIGLGGAETEDSIGDPLVVLYGSDGAELARDDDGGEGLNSWLEFQAPAAGRYYVEARGFVDDAQGRYTLSLVAGEIGANSEGAEYLAPNGEGRTSLIGTKGDVDWFAVELVEGRPYRFNLEGADPDPLADPLIVLYHMDGDEVVEVARDDDGGRGLNSYLTYMSATGGTYFAAVSSFGEGGGTGRYALRVSDSDVPGRVETDEYLDALSDQRLSRIDMPGDLDSYMVELEAGASYVIEVSGAGDSPLADPFLAVLDGAGAQAASDDDSGDGLDARVRFTPENSGSYLIQASGLGGSTGWYQVTITRQ